MHLSPDRVDLYRYLPLVERTETVAFHGRVTKVAGLVIEGYCPNTAVGATCDVFPHGRDPIRAEVVGFRDNVTLLMPLGDLRGVGLGSTIAVRRDRATIKVGPGLLGRVVDGLGEPLDGRPLANCQDEVPLYAEPRNPMSRVPITRPLDLGIRAINGLMTSGEGQRIGIMAGSGVGKSTLLGMIARYTEADVNVIALIGERGRELKAFVEKDLQADGLKKSVIVCATSDQPPLVRMRGAYIATAIAEYFESQGKRVLLMMDSATRFAMAMRDVGLSVGEPPTSRGYTPSVFSALPKLLERAGNFAGGSITGLYTVLVEGDDFNEPVCDTMRSILDGHIILSRDIAAQAIYPSIDIPASVSRVMADVTSPEQQRLASRYRELLAAYLSAKDMIEMDAYKTGTNPRIDEAVRRIEAMTNFQRQAVEEPASLADAQAALAQIFSM